MYKQRYDIFTTVICYNKQVPIDYRSRWYELSDATIVCATPGIVNNDDSQTLHLKKVKASSYIAKYPVLRTAQSALHFTSLAHLFNQTPYQLLWEASNHVLQLMRVGCSYTYPPLYVARYSFIQLSELEQCRVKKVAQDFNIAAQYSRSGSLSGESEAPPLSHCALQLRSKQRRQPKTTSTSTPRVSCKSTMSTYLDVQVTRCLKQYMCNSVDTHGNHTGFETISL